MTLTCPTPRTPGRTLAVLLWALPAMLTAGAARAADAAPATAAPPPTTTTTTGAAPGVGGMVTTSSGLIFKLIKAGQGPSPQASDTVKVHYRGTFTDGREFDSSYKRGAPAEFPLNRVIPCWTEGVQRLQVGGSARLTCPPAIAYGVRGDGRSIPPNTTLNFEVELLGIVGR